MLPITEQENPKTTRIDQVSTLEALSLINAEDKLIASAVENILPDIARVVENVVARLKGGGKLFYIGTGTSGRLGVLDASECPPTFGVSPELIQGVIAGGWDALYKAAEASEDDRAAGASDLNLRGVSGKDAVIGIAASGRTPYTIGALEFARNLGCFTACITCAPDSPITREAAIPLIAIVGPEAIAGSTRMKSGTAQKMVLNMVSTVSMIRLGYVKGNRMTNLRAGNLKLQERSLRVFREETKSDENTAKAALKAAAGDLRLALVMFYGKVTRDEAEQALEEANFVVSKAISKFRA